MVVGDQRSLGGGADLPVEPDRRVEGEQALQDASPQPRGDAAAVTVQAELVLERPDDRLHPLTQPVGEATRIGLVLAGGADQGQVLAGQGGLDVAAGQALVADQHGALDWGGGWVSSSPSNAWRSPASLGLARPNPVVVPSQVTTSSRLAPQ
jgi:hypothetical protein